MADDEEVLELALRRVDELTETILSELGCDTARWVELFVEFTEAVEHAGPLMIAKAERLAQKMPAAMATAYRESGHRYGPDREGFLSILGQRRSRLGLDA